MTQASNQPPRLQFRLIHLLALVICLGVCMGVGKWLASYQAERRVADAWMAANQAIATEQAKSKKLCQSFHDFTASLPLKQAIADAMYHMNNSPENSLYLPHPYRLPEPEVLKKQFDWAYQNGLLSYEGHDELTKLLEAAKRIDYSKPAGTPFPWAAQHEYFWQRFVSKPDENLLLLWIYSRQNGRLFTNHLLEKIRDHNHPETGPAIGYLNWFFAYMPNDQRVTYLERLVQFKFAAQVALQRGREKYVAYTISVPSQGHYGSRKIVMQFRPGSVITVDGRSSALAHTTIFPRMNIEYVSKDETIVGTSDFTVQDHRGVTKGIATLPKDIAPSLHSVRIQINGMFNATEHWGERPTWWHEIPFVIDSDDFDVEVK